MLFDLLYGHHPLSENRDATELNQRLQEFTEIEFPDTTTGNKGDAITTQAKHLIQGLCQNRLSARLSANEALNHPWVTRRLDQKLPLTREE